MADEDNKDAAEENAGGEEEKKDEEEPAILDDKEYEPEVRKSIGEYVAERREKRAQKQQQKGASDENEEGEEGGGELDIDIEERINLGIRKALEPMIPILNSHAIDSEISAFLSKGDNAHFRKYERLVRKDAASYPNVPIARLFRSHAYDDALAMGAERGKQAEERAVRNKVSGNARRPGAQSLNPRLMSKEQKEAIRLRVMLGEKINPEELTE